MSQDRELSANVHPLLATAIILLVAGIFALRYEFSRLALIQPFPTHVTSYTENQLSIVVDNQIFFGNELTELRSMSLEPFGAREQIGAIGRFVNGDWLVRAGRSHGSPLQDIAVYLRLQAKSANRDQEDGILVRCNADTAGCSTFNDSLPAFSRTFGLAIAPDDTVYIADTSEHRLLKISAASDKVLEANTGFDFPNQLVFFDRALWLANTNQHEIVRIDTSDEHFGGKLEVINLIDKGAPRKFEWPVSLTQVRNEWWVLGKGDNLVGGAILRFDAAWNFRGIVALPDNADPAFLYAYGEHVYVTDMEHRRVLRFDHDGTAQEDLAWPALAQMLQQGQQLAARYQRLSGYCLAAFAGVLLGGVFLIWLQARDLRPENSGSQAIVLDDPGIQWIDIVPNIKRQFLLLAVAVTLIVVFLVGSTFLLPHRDPPRLLAMTLAPVAMMIATLVFLYRVTKQRIGIKGETLILVSARGHAAGTAQQILYTPQHLLIDGISVTLGQSSRSIFPHEALMQSVFPLLKDSRSISVSAMQLQLIRTTSPLFLLAGVATIAIPVAIAWLKH
jgi:hypothetical protein